MKQKQRKNKLTSLFRAGREVFPEIPHTKCGNDFLFHAWTQIDISWLFLSPTDQVGQMKYARSMFGDVESAYRQFKATRRSKQALAADDSAGDGNGGDE